MNGTGKVYLVGAGPGDPGLITVKGLKLLKICDTVIYDRLASDSLLDYVKEGCEKIYVGKEAGNHAMKQEEINRLLVEKANTSDIVVRLKGGDPYVFGRGGEEALTLRQQGISYEVIPGVTSAIAALTYAGIPVTHRGESQSFHVITGHTADEETNIPADLQNLAKLNGSLVILMGLGNLERIREVLLSCGKPGNTPAAVIADGTTLKQKEVRGTLQDICEKVKAAGLTSPAVVILGETAALDLRSTAMEVLSGVRVGITGTEHFIQKLSNKLEGLGACTETVSALAVAEYENNPLLEKALSSCEQYGWIVFTSSNAVSVFFHKARQLQIDYRRFAGVKFAVIGSGTREALLSQGFQPDFMPEQYHTNALAKGLCSVVRDRETILIPRAEQGSEELIDILSNQNIHFDDIKIYDLKEINPHSHEWKDIGDRFDYLTFASASGVHAFFKGRKLPKEDKLVLTKIVCIGEATRAALTEYGYEKVLVARNSDAEGLAECICEDVLKNCTAVK